MAHWIPTQWMIESQIGGDSSALVIYRQVGDYDGIKYAVRRGGFVLNKQGQWEFEPMPSSRTDEFFKRCRFDTLLDAKQAAEQAVKFESE